uniref:IMS import disulfide relay-system CHCH-CHCH-like Cx9C domain-containing protein n=1 Tax=Ascaris lumbricoides TaxID=6252 RepID=A0A0M3HIG0_ASCLU
MFSTVDNEDCVGYYKGKAIEDEGCCAALNDVKEKCEDETRATLTRCFR